jgi:arylsulfatase A-like enzyme
LQRTLTRRQFLKTTGAGAAGASLLGASALSSGCSTQPGKWTGANVVLIIIDSLRKDHVGAYGNDWIQTPNLDALAKESLRFTRAYPESFPTICARRAIHTGMRTWPFRDWQRYKGIDIGLWGWQPIPDEQTTLAEILKQNGYATLKVTDNLHEYKPSMNFQRGFDVFDFIRGQTTDTYKPIWTYPPEEVERALGMQEYFQQYFANVAYRQREEDWFSPQVFTRASEVLEAASEGPPFFMVVDNYDPHAPYDPPEEYAALYDEPYDGLEPFSPVYGPSSYLTDRQLQRMRALYAGEVTMMDRWLGRFLSKLEELDLFESTLVVLLSDHGVAHGEHGITGKPPNALWPEVTDIAYMIRHPDGRRGGEASDYYASTHDVPPTILGFLGIELESPMDGQDLSILLDGGQPEERAHFTSGYHTFVWARDGEYAMISSHDGENARLYDIRADPKMRQDIAAGHPEVVRRMFDDYVLGDAGGALPDYDG